MTDQLQIARITPVAFPYFAADYAAIYYIGRWAEVHTLTDPCKRQSTAEVGVA
jgi:hypothetical protein